MSLIKRCSQVSKELVYSTFTEGFSDYMIQLSITKEQFFQIFFQREGNQLEHSFIALEELDSNKGIGIVLGGIRSFDGKKTMRCGGMCVIPGKRGSGVAQLLMEKHKAEAKSQGCEQLFLEVLAENPRAIRLYEKEGYIHRHNLWYYKCENVHELKQAFGLKVATIDFNTVKVFRSSFPDIHMNWQNEMECIEHLPASHFGVYDHGVLKGALSLYRDSILFLAVSEDSRRKGIASTLINSALKLNDNMKSLRTSFPDNESLTAFYENLGFKKDKLFQHEMYQVI